MKQSYLEKIFKEVIEDMAADEKVISQYFSSQYAQYVDGETLNYQEFVQHMLVQKSLLHSAKVTVEHCIMTEDQACTVHRVDAIKKSGEKIAVKVVAYYELDNDKIILCSELTQLLEGGAENQNIGSIK